MKKTVKELFEKFCSNIQYDGHITSVAPYDNSTLFCPAGMQKYKDKFKDESYTGTITNIQRCLRMNDIDEIGDGTHLLVFDMLGLFSFRTMSVDSAIRFWVTFIEDYLHLKLSYVTVHSDKMEDTEWLYTYSRCGIPIKEDEECMWSDGEIGGYCTEFYIDGVEVGNIVNPLGDCIDAGFGLERLQMFYDKTHSNVFTKEEVLKSAALTIIDSGYLPGPKQQGYVLRKIMRKLYECNSTWDNKYYQKEIERQKLVIENYNKLKDKHADKSPEWWYDTHGIDITLI